MSTDDPNAILFGDPDVVSEYAARQQLFFGEKAALDRAVPFITGKRVLDIGVGAGRTTPYLQDCQPQRYVGVDYAENMVRQCQERFPGTEFRVADARSMPEFADASFDFILFSWSGIDCVDHEGRLKVLAEIRRLLVKGGVFVFSSANAAHLPAKPWQRQALADMGFDGTFRGLFRALKNVTPSLINYLRGRGRQVFTDEYVIVLDSVHHCRLLRYAITPACQEAQLLRAGFGSVEAVDRHGQWHACGSPALDDSPIYYFCEKTGD